MYDHFYHKRIRTITSLFGRLFQNLHVVRKDAQETKNLSTIRVPCSYSPKQKFLDRINEQFDDLEEGGKVAIQLPRMGFEMTSLLFDPERAMPKTNYINLCRADGSRHKLYSGVPYIMQFSLSIYGKTQNDVYQIVEQILPYFKPDLTVRIKPFKDFPEFIESVPISLVATSFQDDYEGAQEDRRVLIYTLDFEVKTTFYGNISESAVIRKAIVDWEDMNTGSLLQRCITEPDPIDANLLTDDYGYTETLIIPGHGDSA